MSAQPHPAQLEVQEGERLAAELEAAVEALVAQATRLPDERWAERPSAAYSPIGWHVGHAAAMLERWLLPDEEPSADQTRLFDPFVTPKSERETLPKPADLRARIRAAHARAANRLRGGIFPGPAGGFDSKTAGPKSAPLLSPSFLVHHLVEHALQHAEHVTVVGALCEGRLFRPAAIARAPLARPLGRVELPGGTYSIGAAAVDSVYDNECPAFGVELGPFWAGAAPVTVSEYAAFVDACGYGDERLWTAEGWAAAQRLGLRAPLGWVEDGGRFIHPDGAADHPVTGVSWFEANAYARFAGARLLTEAEWEVAAGGGRRAFPDGAMPTTATANVGGARGGTTPVGSFPLTDGFADLAGNVWEWTSSWFEPYPGFRPYPYAGYSTPWFRGTHRVLRGGSWATAPRLCRVSFRNWYEPAFRELPAGFRIGGDLW